MSTVHNENTQFVDSVTGELINNGYVYFGDAGVDPVLNPKNVYDNRQLTGAALANPQRTGTDGRLLNKVWVDGKYSMKVTDVNDVQKLLDLDRGEIAQAGNSILINSLGINDVTATGSPTVTTLTDNQTYIFSAPAANTGAMTLAIDAIAAKPIKKGHDAAIESGDIKADQKIVVVYNSTDDWFEIQSNVLNSVFNGRASFTNTDDVDLVGVSGAVIIGGDGTGQHIAVASNEIASKLTATSAGTLSIQADGGSVDFGANTGLTAVTIDATSISGTAILDEDDMASDSATKLATQQSIKAYADGKVSSGFISGASLSSGALPTGWSIDSSASNITTIQMGASDTLHVTHAVTVLAQDTAGGTTSGSKIAYINQSTAKITADQFDVVCLDGGGTAATTPRFGFLIIEM